MRLVVAAYNALISSLRRHPFLLTGWRELDEIQEHSMKRTDISDHLVTLFVEAIAARPRLIVELGVRQGESTFVFERVAKLCGSQLISVDIQDGSAASSYEGWIFERSDDIEFAKRFDAWCGQRHIEARIDVLFIDTSHLFGHTVAEIEHWFPFLSEKSKVMFHDTNCGKIYSRKDGSVGVGWNNKRGVIAALERLFDRPFNEKEHFVEWAKGWAIRHYPHCAGMTVLEKLPCQRTPLSELQVPSHPNQEQANLLPPS
jgi:cephalosporin hydroxylase